MGARRCATPPGTAARLLISRLWPRVGRAENQCVFRQQLGSARSQYGGRQLRFSALYGYIRKRAAEGRWWNVSSSVVHCLQHILTKKSSADSILSQGFSDPYSV